MMTLPSVRGSMLDRTSDATANARAACSLPTADAAAGPRGCERRAPTRGRAGSWALVLVLALAAPGARAQPSEPAASAAQGAAPAPPAQEAAPKAIPVNEIASQAEAVESWAREVESELGADLEDRTRERLEQTQHDISRRQAALDQLPVGPSAARALAAERAGWQELGGSLAEVQDEVGRAGEILERRLHEADERGARWKLTAAAAQRAGVPPAVLAVVREARNTLDREREHIEKRRNQLLDLEQRALLQRRSVNAAIARVDLLRSELRSRLLEQNQPPLWTLRPVADTRAELGRFASAADIITREIRDYVVRNREHLFLQLGLIAFLIWAALRVRSIARRTGGEAEGTAVLRHPVSAGLLAGLVPARAFSPDAPPGLLELLATLALLPWLRVLSGVLPRALHPALRWLAVLVLLDVTRGMLYAIPLLGRFALILELALGAAVVASVRRPERMSSISGVGGRGWQRAIDLWLRLALVALVAGIPATILGYVELANLLAGTPVLGSFMATVLFAVVLLLDLLLRACVEAGALDRVHLIRTQHRALLRGSARLFRALAVGVWLYLILDFTTLGDPLWSWVGRVLAAPIGYGSVSLTLGGLLAFFLAVWGSWLLSRFSAFVLDTEVFPRVRMPAGIPFALATFTRYGVLFAGFVVALGMIGFSLDRVTILVGALGVGVGFGLQNVVNNFVSGIILLFERPVRVGDRIQIDDLVGDVTRIGLRASRVRTLDGIDLIVPNADFVSTRVANWTLADHARRVSVDVGVTYGTRPQRVLDLLLGVARAHPEVLASPEPEVLFKGFGDSSLDFELRVWTDGRLIFRVQSDLAVATCDALAEAGIEVPFPQRDLHLRSVSPAAAKALPGGGREDDRGERRAPGAEGVAPARSPGEGST